MNTDPQKEVPQTQNASSRRPRFQHSRSQPQHRHPRFQYSLAELLLFVLSIGACWTAYHLGWISFAAPVVWGWTGFIASKIKRRWLGGVLCFAILVASAFAFLWFGVFGYEQSPYQRALPLSAQSWSTAPTGSNTLMAVALVCNFGPFLLAGVLWWLLLRIPRLRRMAQPWALVGCLVGLLFAGTLALYPEVRALHRRSVFLNHKDQIEVNLSYLVWLGGGPKINRLVFISQSQNRAFPYGGILGSEPKHESTQVIYISVRDAEEIADLLHQHGGFHLNQYLYLWGTIDGADEHMEIIAGTERFSVTAWQEEPFCTPLENVRERLIAWAESKGHQVAYLKCPDRHPRQATDESGEGASPPSSAPVTSPRP